ncbi:hypothetical protein [Saccharopolyspora sp. NPDC050642]|uniref:hypothetical protein n=1 Tax=Saccharopolyspora sp. NPDC050642 TaxID=3157099 RepID=UPI0034092F5D
MAEVKAFYQSLVEANAVVMWVNNQDISVNDTGFSGELEFFEFVPEAMLGGETVFGSVQSGVPGEVYPLKRTLAFHWPYDERCRLIGEHVYEDIASREITKPDPADVISPARAAELLAPEIDKVLP